MLTALGVAASPMFALVASGRAGAKVTVKALARGTMNAAPFFRAASLAVDLIGTISALESGSKTGATSGPYGGTRRSPSCDKGQLVKYLKENAERSAAWAEVRGIDIEQIESYINNLSPVLVPNDTLAMNYDYNTRKMKPMPVYALLEAGAAVLIDAYGLPMVQCCCGSPLWGFDESRDDVEVDFDTDRDRDDGDGKGKKAPEWKGFDRKEDREGRLRQAEARRHLPRRTHPGGSTRTPAGITARAHHHTSRTSRERRAS
ncbi:DUF6777 domain-containing protein [Streptomyces sp. NPDC057621]|uniref:DUF6777 domain-containing protein n=1 Tax=Streptomyces sp. NPDC057621 TaxID=3346186 RepID=UPI0036CBC106